MEHEDDRMQLIKELSRNMAGGARGGPFYPLYDVTPSYIFIINLLHMTGLTTPPFVHLTYHSLH